MEATVHVPCPPAVTATRRAPPSLPLRPSLGGPERAPKISSRLLAVIGSLALAVLVLFGVLASKHCAVTWLLPGEDGPSGDVFGKRSALSKEKGGGMSGRSVDPSVQVDAGHLSSTPPPPPPGGHGLRDRLQLSGSISIIVSRMYRMNPQSWMTYPHPLLNMRAPFPVLTLPLVVFLVIPSRVLQK